MARAGRKGREPEAGAAPPHEAQARQVFLLDEVGRFVAGATREGVALKEPMLHPKALEAARALVKSREVAWGTFVGKVEGDVSVVVCGGRDFFACAAEDPGRLRDVPHELSAVVAAFEHAAREEVRAGGLSKASIEAFPRVVAAALKDPARFSTAPKGPLAFARASFRPSGARLALDVEVVNATPWAANRVELRLAFDSAALPLVSVKARNGAFEDGVLELPQVAARSRERVVVLFEPKAAGTHAVEGTLRLVLEGGREERGRMRPARARIAQSDVVPTVPKGLAEFRALVEGRLAYAAKVEVSTALGGLSTVAGLASAVEKDSLARLLDWRGAGAEREVWFLGLVGGETRPLFVQLTQGLGGAAGLVVAGAQASDVIAYAARLRARLDAGYGPSTLGEPRIAADQAPEPPSPEPRAVMVARQISADIASGEIEIVMRKPRQITQKGVSTMLPVGGGQSVGEEMVPGLIEELERSMRRDGPPRR